MDADVSRGGVSMITLADVRAASERIAGKVLRTPTLRSDAVSRATGVDVTLKLENLQAACAFAGDSGGDRHAPIHPAHEGLPHRRLGRAGGAPRRDAGGVSRPCHGV